MYKLLTYYSLILLIVVIVQGLILVESLRESIIIVLFIPVLVHIFINWRKLKTEGKVKSSHFSDIPKTETRDDSY